MVQETSSGTDALQLLLCGSTRWDVMGRKSVPKAVEMRGGSAKLGEEYLGPVRVQFPALRVKDVYAGCAAAHFLVVDQNGRLWGMGRNEMGQLGKSDLKARRDMTRLHVPVEEKEEIVHAACGRSHTLVVTSEGKVWGVGANGKGELGIGEKQEKMLEWRCMKIEKDMKVVKCAVGGEFSVVVCDNGRVYSCGSGQYGQLGNGRTGECIESRNRIAYDAVDIPVRVKAFGEEEGKVKIVQVACGVNHVVALDQHGKVWSWGFGGYGRLGHKIPKDEWTPRRIDIFQSNVYRLDMIACGQMSSFASQASRKSCFMWGMTKRTGESNMYPKTQFDLQGCQLTSIASGNTSVVVATEKSVITWGSSPTFGELGYGQGQPKSSTKPRIVNAVEGLLTRKVVMGMAFTIMLAEKGGEEEKQIWEKLPVLELGEEEEEEEKPDHQVGGKRKKANGKVDAKKKKATKRRRR